MIDVAGAGLYRGSRARFTLAVELTRITFPYLLLVSLVTLYGGILNALAALRGGGRGADPAQPLDDRRARWRPSFPTPGHAAAWGVLIAGILEVLLVGGDALRGGVTAEFCAGRDSTPT